mmetsp:Transcript_6972/g.13157  ORF Transcript_6972/g.13157 Transcript_6972/m.13157 type:complete len:687 (+) Transcript_6972:223-2283(+)
MNKKELAHCVFVEDDHGVETIFELPNGTSEIEKKENNYKVSHVDDIRTENHSQSPKKNTSSTHVCDEKNDIMNRNGLERELYTTASMESNVSVSGNSSSGGSNSSSSCIAAAKELILSVTKEEEEEEDHGRRSDNVSKPNHENRRHDPLDKSQITAIADNNSNNNNKKIITESSIVDESNKDDGEHIDGNNIPLDKQHKTKRVLKTPLRIATSVPSDSSIRNDAIKSPMRCESPGMRRRREELGRSHRSIRELEEQLYQTEIDYQHQRQQQQQQLQLAQNQVVNTQSQHSIDRFFEAPEIQDCGQSLSSTTSSTISSFGLLHNSSRTLLSSSNAAIDNDCSSDDKVSNVSNNRDQPRKNDVTVLRKAFSGQRDSSSIIPSEEDASNTQPVSSWGTPKAANRSSPTIERDDENGGGGGGGREIDALKAYYEEKLMWQRRTHEHQIDEIIEQLNSIESNYGSEILSLQKRLSQKEIMTEVLTNSLSEIKQQHELVIAKMEEARNEVQSANDRYTALKYRMEREKTEAVETACNEIRNAAESQFASAQKTFIKLKQDYVATCEDRNALKKQCNELAGKVDTLEAKARSYQNKITKLVAEGAEAKAEMATEKADALKMKQAYTEKVQVFIEKEKDVERRIAKANRDCEEAYALLQEAIKEKEALKKENADLQSVCEELMSIVEETHGVTK